MPCLRSLEVRGLDFEPAADYLVVLLSGGSAYDSPSLFKPLAGRSGTIIVSLRELGPFPVSEEIFGARPPGGLECTDSRSSGRAGEAWSGEQVWEDQIQSGMRWTPDAAQSLAVSSSRYIQHSAGECRRE